MFIKGYVIDILRTFYLRDSLLKGRSNGLKVTSVKVIHIDIKGQRKLLYGNLKGKLLKNTFP